MTLIIGMFGFTLFAENTEPDQTIDLKKIIPTGPSRVPSLYPASFNGLFLMGEITISAENYSGEILIQITGVNGSVTQTVPVSETENAVIDVSGTNYTFAIKNGLITGFSRTP